MPARPQFSAEDVPLPESLTYTTEDGEVLCSTCAGREVQHMVRKTVKGWLSYCERNEVCNRCGKSV